MPSGYDDDDDWVGTPPEGRHTRDRANPGFWRRGMKTIEGFIDELERMG